MFKPGLTAKIFIALILGVLFGTIAPEWAVSIKFLGDMFIRMIKLIVIPLVFSSLIVGITEIGDFSKMGRLGIKTIIWFEAATAIALVFGLLAGNLLQPGAGIHLANVDLTVASELAKKSVNLHDFIVGVIPSNIIAAMSGGDMLQVVVFSCVFGVAMAAIGKKAQPVLDIATSVSAIMFQFTHYVMRLAPFGVFAYIAYTVGKHGVYMLLPLAKLIGVLYLAVFVFIAAILFTISAFAKVNFFQLLRALREPLMLAFSTAAGEAAFPLAMERLEKFGVPNKIAAFVFPIGFSFNLNGSALFCTLSTLFVAQVYHVDLSWLQQLTLFFMFMLSSKGIAAVPGASLIIIAGTAIHFGLPVEGVALILGVDRIMDMARTVCNLLGNCVATVVIARWEGALPQSVLKEAYKLSYNDAEE
ncbi:MAG: cation:dicarboxylase symporter family transporter [Negativicutes bacterium]|jgi:proton glutamate symport protein